MTRLFLLISTCLLLASTYSKSRDVIDRVVAVVNEDVITLTEFNKFLLEVPEEVQSDKYKVLNDLVDQKLIVQKAADLGITVTDQEIDQSILNMQNKLGMSEEDMQQMLTKENLTEDQLRNQWRMQLISNKLVSAKLKGNIAVTDDEVKERYIQYYGEIENAEEVKIAHILINYNSDGAEDSLEKAQKVYEMAKSGENFEELVSEYSDDTLSKDKQGELGYFKKGELVGELEEAVENTKVGDISEPVKTSSGYHIVKVLDRKTQEESSVDEYREQLKYEIYREKAAVALENFLADTRKDAYIEIKL